jgi:hypothetical protein
MNDNQIEVFRSDKLIALGLDSKLPISKIDDSALNLLYEIHVVSKKKEDNKKEIHPKQKKNGIYVKKPKNSIKIDKNDNKYKVTLEFLNALFKVINRKTINDITEFKDVKRDDLLKENCKKVLDEYLEKIIKQFGKTKIAYRNKNLIDIYILTVIKSLASECGYNFKSQNKMKYKTIAEKDFKYHLEIIYSISD